MSSGSKAEPVDNIGRRKWDVEVYKKRQKELLEQEEKEVLGGAEAERRLTIPVEREALKRRTWAVDLTKNVGKRLVVASSAALSEQGGFYCDVCECRLSDSSAWLSHINGRKHQMKKGMSMKAERATVQEVKDRLEFHKRRRDAKVDEERGIEARLAAFDEEQQRKRKRRRRKRRKEKEAAKDEPEELTEEQKAMIAAGFSIGFGGSKANT